VLRDVTASGLEATQLTIGFYGVGGGSASLTDVVANASAAAGTIIGVFNDNVAGNLTNVTATASGGGVRYGLVNGQGVATTTTVDRSTLSGPSGAILGQAASTTRVAGSKLVGPVTNIGGSTSSCLFSYNGNYTVLNAACQ
jgi:hypothetical protein